MDPMIWVIDDDSSIRFVFDRGLEFQHINHRLFETGDAALQALKKEIPDVIVSDIRMPGISGLDLIKAVHDVDEDIPFIIITAHSDLTAAVDSYEKGTFEYVPKPFDINQVVSVIRRAALHRFNLKKQKEQTDPEKAEASASIAPQTSDIIGRSPAMQDVFKSIGRISKTNLPVLIHGEEGTGRELVAQALHKHSERQQAQFVSLNMTSIPKDLIEKELFGDTQSSKAGAVERAEHGTLFINAIDEMPLNCQTRLLQLLQNGTYLKVGSDTAIQADCRVIASCSKDMEELTASGKFIADLFYRLNVINIRMPALRERSNDIPLLAKHFLAISALDNHTEPKKMTSDVLVFLCRQTWPGNVRQLKNLCKYLTIMVTGHDIQMVDLPQDFIQSQQKFNKSMPTTIAGGVKENLTWQEALRKWVDERLKAGEQDILAEAVPEFEKVLLEATLNFTGNHKQESAKLLGWGRNTLTRKIKELQINK
ncbi:MAG: nitrogen regulation protein NR(I) [Succinivibrio sp.]|nr:nitrogen regulation protein NR(I) [Succinivibrio sp.]